jgi:hypothetical protein
MTYRRAAQWPRLQAVETLPAAAAHFHQLRLLEHPQVQRDGWVRRMAFPFWIVCRALSRGRGPW